MELLLLLLILLAIPKKKKYNKLQDEPYYHGNEVFKNYEEYEKWIK